jgi:Putative MetA-pathway of phenol degradation
MKYGMWLLFLLAGCTSLSPEAKAEEKEQSINSGRPGFNETLGIIPTGRIQQEMGYIFNRDGSSREHELGQLMLRLGTGGGTELQLGVNSFALTRGPEGNTSGVQDSTVGFKILLAKGGEEFQLFKPAVAFVAGTSIPTGARAYRESSWQPQAKLSLGWTFSNRSALSATMISTVASQESKRFMQRAAGVSPSYNLTNRWGCYAEVFAQVPGGPGASSDLFAGGGLTYLAGKELQLDMNFGRRLNGDETSYFLGAGLAKLW